MEIVSAGESVICVFIAISFLSTDAIPLKDEEGPEDRSSITYADSPRHRKDLSESSSTELVQAILPVQVDIGTLVSGFDEMRKNMEIVKANQARVEEENGQLKSQGEENARLIEQLKASIANETKARNTAIENEAKARKLWEEEYARLIEQLKVFKENENKDRYATTAKPESPNSQTPASATEASEEDDCPWTCYNQPSLPNHVKKKCPWHCYTI